MYGLSFPLALAGSLIGSYLLLRLAGPEDGAGRTAGRAVAMSWTVLLAALLLYSAEILGEWSGYALLAAMPVLLLLGYLSGIFIAWPVCSRRRWLAFLLPLVPAAALFLSGWFGEYGHTYSKAARQTAGEWQSPLLQKVQASSYLRQFGLRLPRGAAVSGLKLYGPWREGLPTRCEITMRAAKLSTAELHDRLIVCIEQAGYQQTTRESQYGSRRVWARDGKEVGIHNPPAGREPGAVMKIVLWRRRS